MSEYSTDEEQVETLRRWWDEWGRSVLVGLALAAAGVLGFRSWESTRAETAAQAASQFEQYLQAAERLDGATTPEDIEAAETGWKYLADQINAEHPGSGYAAFVALDQARRAVEQDDLDAARTLLAAALDADITPRLEALIRYRQARVEVAAGNDAAALALLDQVQGEGLRAAVGELRGDILFRSGDIDAARTAYQAATEGLDPVPPLLRLKLDDLGAGSAAVIAAETAPVPAGDDEAGAGTGTADPAAADPAPMRTGGPADGAATAPGDPT